MYLHLADRGLSESAFQRKWRQFKNYVGTRVGPAVENVIKGNFTPRGILGRVGQVIDFAKTGDFVHLDPTTRPSKQQVRNGLIAGAVLGGATLLGLSAGLIPVAAAGSGKAALLPASSGGIKVGTKLKDLLGINKEFVQKLAGSAASKLLTDAAGRVVGFQPGVNPSDPLNMDDLQPIGDPPPMTNEKDNTLLYLGMGLLAIMALK
ncbi:MAG: hypothetical protein VKL39_21670 [Leptolyngbyaceae bacterium]|nr:hypothetical protein [Leptolyngbyaceae bacterium]